MGFKLVFLFSCLVAAVSAQTYRVCVSTAVSSSTCQSISRDDSQVTCQRVESRVDCALKLAAGQADLGYFSEEETLLLSQQQPNDNRVLATVRDESKLDPYAFETVAVVPANHTRGLDGLSGGVYCHPGLDESDLRWSPRVLKNLEQLAARTDRCPEANTAGKTAEELEVETLSKYFSSGCRPGAWSNNVTVDTDLKSRYPSLCSRCGPDSGCSRYTIDMGVSIANVRNDNRHIQALECLRTNANASSAVAYVAWQHVVEYFTIRNPQDSPSFAVLCPNGTLASLTTAVLSNTISPCAFIRQPWGAIVANTNNAAALLTSLKTWWPAGSSPATGWQSTLFSVVTGGSSSARVVFQDSPISLLNYTSAIRTISNIDSTASCMPARRWCTISTLEQTKCNWVRVSAHTLGVQPSIACQQRNSVLECLNDIKDDRADFISAPSNYGYLARQHYKLTPVKLVQNSPDDASRVAAFVKESAVISSNVTRYENLRGKNACFPEYGGLAYMSFVRVGQERGVLSSSECDYAAAVGEFFGGACAPGAIDASHALSESSSFNSSVLCSSCRTSVNINGNNSTCAWDYTNMYFGNNGTLACLNDPNNDVAFLNTRSMATHLTSLGLQATQFRALCRNNSLAATTGISIDDNCLLAYVVDAEIVTRRNDPQYNSLNTLLDSLDTYFGYNAASGNQLINLEIFSPFNENKNLLFKDSTIGLTEASLSSSHEPARNYIELFRHLQACTGTAPPIAGLANRSFYSIVTLLTMAIMTRFVIY
ncbi:transferrin isoform X2 [Helicoverpa armigera]|uniref:transferrin isoform X1 n=1 Tax=Helicoverpa armigera TaxID=29058 RepID=UPI003082C272